MRRCHRHRPRCPPTLLLSAFKARVSSKGGTPVKKRPACIARDGLLLVALTHAVWLGFDRLPVQPNPPQVVDPTSIDSTCQKYVSSMEVWIPGGPDLAQRMEDADI